MMAAQDLITSIFDFINPWGPILTSIAWAIRAAHHSTYRKKQTEKMRSRIYRNYYQEFWTGMHKEMFGANRYRAFQLELEYIKHHSVKPYEVNVRKAMQRVDVLLTYLPFFPPRTVRSDRPTDKEWAAFNVTKQVDDKIKRDIQYRGPSFTFLCLILGGVGGLKVMICFAASAPF